MSLFEVNGASEDVKYSFQRNCHKQQSKIVSEFQ